MNSRELVGLPLDLINFADTVWDNVALGQGSALAVLINTSVPEETIDE